MVSPNYGQFFQQNNLEIPTNVRILPIPVLFKSLKTLIVALAANMYDFN